MRLGKTVRRARESQGLGLRQTALLLGISPAYLSKVELGHEAHPKQGTLQNMANLLGLDVDQLCCLAGRVPLDVQDIICGDHELPMAIRALEASGLGGKDMVFWLNNRATKTKIHAKNPKWRGPLCCSQDGARHRQLHQNESSTFLVSQDPDNRDVTCARCLKKL